MVSLTGPSIVLSKRFGTFSMWHVMSGTSLQELMELGGWKSYEMVLRYAHLALEHLSAAAARIERGLDIVENDSTISLR